MKYFKGNFAKMNKTIIITSYMENSVYFDFDLSPEDYVICTDGGYDIALQHGIKPDLLLGDFDSINAPLPNDVKTLKFNPEKDFTDLDLALRYASELPNNIVEIWGGIGGRFDHTFANVQLVSSYCNSFSKLTVMDGKNKYFCISSDVETNVNIQAEPNTYLSLFSLSETVVISACGVKYPLHKHTLKRIFPLGVSNEFTSEKATITVEKGTLLIILSKM
jgi:thiamine pyrophosphokinase